MAMLTKIEIKGYRSIKSANLELRKLNVLIGANGAGKSNFISFFKMLHEMMAGRLQEYVGKYGRGQSVLHFGPKVTPQLEASLDIEDSNACYTYTMRLIHGANDTLTFGDEILDTKENLGGAPADLPVLHISGLAESQLHLLASVNMPINIARASGDSATNDVKWAARRVFLARDFLEIIKNYRVYHFHDTSPLARMRQFCYINDNRYLLPDAGNLPAMLFLFLQRFPMVYKRIVSTVRKIIPEFDDFDLGPSRLNPNDIILNWRKQGYDYLFGPHQLSDGTLRSIALCTLFLQPEESLPDVIILDEPELGLHPHALEITAGLMRAASEKMQVIVATQSKTLLDFFEPEEIIVAQSHNGQSEFSRLESEKLKDWLEDYSIGELWQRNVVGGGPVP